MPTHKQPVGIFTISLDFELMWGVRDHTTTDAYRARILGTRAVIPVILDKFIQHGVHATWATVGLLYNKDAHQLQSSGMPLKVPSYINDSLSPYPSAATIQSGDNALFFAPDLISTIKNTNGQEIGTHTYCHYYCLEPGQNAEDFSSDLDKAIDTAEEFGVPTKSLVFPRNQWNEDYLKILSEKNIESFRGNESSWMYSATDGAGNNLIKRVARLIDTYINISGHHIYSISSLSNQTPINIAASRFLRPFSKGLKFLETRKINRIKDSMSAAAREGKIFHLWWHPHNFGSNQAENLANLEKLLKHFKELNLKYGMASLTMSEISNLVKGEAA